MKLINIILLVILSNQIQSQSILGLKERARVISEIQKDRLDNLLPKLMDETGIDMWVLITREYNEDPIIKTLLPPTWLNARRRTIIAFYHDKDENKVEKVERLKIQVSSLLSRVRLWAFVNAKLMPGGLGRHWDWF